MIFTIQTNSLKQLIADEIKRRIVYGELEFGQKISENSLAQELETKRTPVREAFILLQGEDLVTIVPQKGTYVFTVSEEELAQIIEHRFILEYASLQSLQKKATRQQFIGEIEGILQGHSEALRKKDIRDCEKFDSAFHEKIIEYSNNKYIISSYKIIYDRAKAIRFRTVATLERSQSVLKDHEELFRMFVEENMKQCRSTLKRHLNNVLKNINKPGVYERIFQMPFPGKGLLE